MSLAQMRRVGDPLADDAVGGVFERGQLSAVRKLMDRLAENDEVVMVDRHSELVVPGTDLVVQDQMTDRAVHQTHLLGGPNAFASRSVRDRPAS
jgi:hypothetical protein